MEKYLLILLTFLVQFAFAQDVVNCNEITPAKDYENIHIKKLDTDNNKTSFIIWVKESVRPHKHEHHTETLYVLQGSGDMKIGDKTYYIKSGDYINVPKGSVHSVIVSSEEPLKVISVQAPEFLGKDRVFVE